MLPEASEERNGDGQATYSYILASLGQKKEEGKTMH